MSEAIDLLKAFDASRAEIYDRQFEPLRAIKDAMHLVMHVHFASLPADARILIAGAGTGAEARFLAPLFPGWRFTLVDPAAPMLDVARRHAEAGGFADRCVFHVGFVSSLPHEAHDAAASVLVSHFLTAASARQAFFEDIAARLKPGGLLFDADLCADPQEASFDAVMDLWLSMMAHSGMMDAEGKVRYRAMFGREFAAHGPAEVEAILGRAGFSSAACFQVALIRGWIASRS